MAFGKPNPFEDGSHASESRPLLPSAMANTLRDSVRFVVGALILVATLAAWASLLSWSVEDPSLSHATALTARNWLGRPGAILSDLIIQTFGLAALIVLLAPMFWGAAFVQREAVPKFSRRLWTYLAAIFCLASAAGALPVPLSWPLHHGLGGIIGDAAFRVASAPFAVAHAEFGRPIAGVTLLAVGFWCAFQSLGLSRATIALRVTTQRTRSHTKTKAAATQRVEPVLTQRPAPAPAPSIDPRTQTQFGPYAAAIERDDDEPVDPEFEAWTQAASGGIAARFAPQSQTPRNLQDSVEHAFGGDGFSRDGSTQMSRLAASAELDQPAYELMPSDAPATSRTNSATKAQAYKRPSLNLLERPSGARGKAAYAGSMLRGNARLLEDVLADFGVLGEIRVIVPGPVVTLYELEPARGTNADRVISLADDIARGMSVPSVRIAQITGRSALAIEMPNQVREVVVLRDILDAEGYRSTMDALPVALGRTVTGEPVVGDLTRMPHLLVAGANGSGKSGGINAMILSLLYKHGPDDCRFLMIDPKMLDLAVYNGIPHLLTPVVTDPHKAITALAWCVTEMEERTKRMAALGVRTIDVFNNRVRNAKKRGERLARTVQTGFDQRTGHATYEHEEMNLEPMPYIVIVIDEFAGLMAVAGREIEGAVQRLAVAARAAGIHLIMATERPTADIVTGALKSNLPARISYKAASKVDSRAVLGTDGAERLLGSGDMLFANGAGQPQRLHGPFVSDAEVESVTGSLRQQGAPRYIDGIVGHVGSDAPRDHTAEHTGRVTFDASSTRTSLTAASEDALYDRAVAILIRDRRASLIHLQRRLNISPSWAASLLQRLEADGVVSPPDANGQCQVLAGQAA